MNKLLLTSPMCVSVNHYLAYRVINNKKTGRPMAMSYETKEAIDYKKNFKKYVEEQVNIQNWSLKPNKEQHFYVDAVFYFPRIDMDANNYFKIMLDSITDTQLIWLDDNVVCERVNRIYYDSENPRIELTIYPVEYVGIFDSSSTLEEFENKCKDCSRYCRNCSILKKAKEGRIQEDIENMVCKKFKKKR